MTPTFTGTLYWLFNFQFQLCQWKFAPCYLMMKYLMMIDITGPQLTVRWSSSQDGWRIRFRTYLAAISMTTGWLPSCSAPRRASARTEWGRGGGLLWSPAGPGSSIPCHHSGQTSNSYNTRRIRGREKPFWHRKYNMDNLCMRQNSFQHGQRQP